MDIELVRHCNEVSIVAKNIACELDMHPFCIEQIRIAALYHDIGKMHIPKSILNKPGKLTNVERQVMIAHTYIGFWILQASGFRLPDIAAEVALDHHENFDGSGYYGKQDDEISLESHIIHVADVYSALLSDRVYRPAWGLTEATDYIENNAGVLFDPMVVDAFLKLADGYSDMVL